MISRGLALAYERGWWCPDDLTGSLRRLLRGALPVLRVLDRLGAALSPVLDPLHQRRHRADRERDRRNIRAHYDIGNDFYRLMLDPGMTYSCAVFDDGGDLAAAQVAKLDRICRLLDLGPDDELVEIGTGWGSFAEHAAERYGCRVTTTTISAEQHALASARLGGSVTVLDRDYRDLDGTYDALASVEMIEAVDWREHETYFDAVARLLRPGGRACLQAIVIEDGAFERAKRHDDFIRASIFPGGCLPSVASIRAHAERAGLVVRSVEPIGRHYPATLRAWRDNVHAHLAEVHALGLDDRFVRRWDFYLAYCEAGFLEGRVDTVHVVLDAPA